MSRPRVLVVDDSVVVRRLVSKALEDGGAVQVVGVAGDGRQAIANIERLRPDLVTLDVEMPVMDGLEALREIRRRWPRLPVIMFSTLTSRGAEVTLDALTLGADDYVLKPSSTGSPIEGMTRIRADLLPRILALCPGARDPMPATEVRDGLATPRPRPTLPTERVDVVAIGVSTGGPTALAKVIAKLPASLPTPVLIVQHMPPMFTRILAERLDHVSPLQVMEGADGQRVEAGRVWIAPGDQHMAVERHMDAVRVRLSAGPPEHSCRPSVDTLFRSVAQAYGGRSLGVVMTGMGADGVAGSRALREQGARVIVQDEASSVVWGMPGNVAREGLADAVVSLDSMPGEIVRRAKYLRDETVRRSPAEVTA